MGKNPLGDVTAQHNGSIKSKDKTPLKSASMGSPALDLSESTRVKSSGGGSAKKRGRAPSKKWEPTEVKEG